MYNKDLKEEVKTPEVEEDAVIEEPETAIVEDLPKCPNCKGLGLEDHTNSQSKVCPACFGTGKK